MGSLTFNLQGLSAHVKPKVIKVKLLPRSNSPTQSSYEAESDQASSNGEILHSTHSFELLSGGECKLRRSLWRVIEKSADHCG